MPLPFRRNRPVPPPNLPALPAQSVPLSLPLHPSPEGQPPEAPAPLILPPAGTRPRSTTERLGIALRAIQAWAGHDWPSLVATLQTELPKIPNDGTPRTDCQTRAALKDVCSVIFQDMHPAIQALQEQYISDMSDRQITIYARAFVLIAGRLQAAIEADAQAALQVGAATEGEGAEP